MLTDIIHRIDDVALDMEEENAKKRGELTESYLRLRDSIEDSARKTNTKGNLEPDSPPRSERYLLKLSYFFLF